MLNDIAITIKPTLACNMQCKHCFNGENMNNLEMLPIATALKVIELASEEYHHVKVTFHGGEPTMMGYDYYEEFYSFEKNLEYNKGTKFSNFFTTNGLLLDERYINLFKVNGTMINISFDGPFNNVLRNNTEKVYENILLAKNMNAKMRIFCTLTAKSIGELKKTYLWFNERKLDFKIAPIEPWGYATAYPELLLDPDEYLQNLMEVYVFWLKDKDCQIRFNTFEEFVNFSPEKQFKPFWFNQEIALNPNGKLYPFGRPNDIQYCLGKAYELDKISDCFQSQQYKALLSKLQSSYYQRCRGCMSKNVCNGVVENITYMYVNDEQLVDTRCYIADQIFQRAIAINNEIRSRLSDENLSEFNPVAQKFLSDRSKTNVKCVECTK